MKNLLPLGLLLSLVLSCSIATRPNVSALYHIPALKTQLPPLSDNQKLSKQRILPVRAEKMFQKLYSLDPILTLEVGRLPEFQDEIGEIQMKAMSNLIEIISHATINEKETLAEFMKVGQPNIRRYCTPLQALFWLLEKQEYNSKLNPLKCASPSLGRPCLDDLLSKAWNFSENNRWEDYEIVTDRLNAPELIDYYEKSRFIYALGFEASGNPFSVFKSNKGHCADVTAFTVYCLKKAGYKAFDYHVPSPTGRHRYHIVTLFEAEGKEYIMDNGRLDMRGIVPKSEYNPF